MEPQSNMEQCTSNMMQNMTWYARCDMQCLCVLRKGNDEQGINLVNQVCRWKDEMISVEIDIKITGNGCKVCKWQASQEWRKYVINSMMPLRMQQEIYLVKGGRLGLMPGDLFHSCRLSFCYTGVMFLDFAFLTRLGDLWDPLDSSLWIKLLQQGPNLVLPFAT